MIFFYDDASVRSNSTRRFKKTLNTLEFTVKKCKKKKKKSIGERNKLAALCFLR